MRIQDMDFGTYEPRNDPRAIARGRLARGAAMVADDPDCPPPPYPPPPLPANRLPSGPWAQRPAEPSPEWFGPVLAACAGFAVVMAADRIAGFPGVVVVAMALSALAYWLGRTSSHAA